MILEQHPEIQQMPESDKLTLMWEIWDDVMDPPSNSARARAIEQELEAAEEECRLHPERITTWEDAKKRILASRNKS